APPPGETPGGPLTSPVPAPRNPPEASGGMGDARASHCARLHIPGGGDKAAQLCRVTAHVISTGRVDSAAVYCEAELDASAMALGGLGHHAPVSVKRRGNCGRSGTDGCGSGRQSDGTDTIADHGSPPVSRPGARLLGDVWLTRMNESRRRIERSTARVTPQHTGNIWKNRSGGRSPAHSFGWWPSPAVLIPREAKC